jgi:hypothetical protein
MRGEPGAGADPVERALRWLVPAGFAVVLVRLFEAVAAGPLEAFNPPRVAAAVAMARGYRILTGPDEGPALDFMYGPVAALAYLPAAASPTATGAVWVGVVLSLLFALAPVVWLAWPRSPASAWLALLAVAAFGIGCIHDPALRLAAFDIHADAPALALAGAACAAVLVARGEPSNTRLLAAGALAALAVWSKQTAAPIVAVLPLLVWLRDGRRAGVRAAVLVGAAGAAVSLAFVAWLGLDRIAYTMFQIPGGHPFKPVGVDPEALARDMAGAVANQTPADRLRALLHSAGIFAGAAAPSALLAAAVAAALARGRAARATPLRREPALALALTGLAMVPVSVLGGAKLGGYTNAYALSTWFFAAAAAVGLLSLAGSGPRRQRRIACCALAGVAVIGAANELRAERRSALAEAVRQVASWRSNPLERSVGFARRHPGEVLFATNPLIGLYSDGVLYHSTIGLYDRRMAGLEVSDALLRRHLPERMRFLVLPRLGWFALLAKPPPELGGFTVLRPVPELPDHRVWMAPPGAGGRDGRRGPRP